MADRTDMKIFKGFKSKRRVRVCVLAIKSGNMDKNICIIIIMALSENQLKC